IIACAKRAMLDELRNSDYIKRNLRAEVRKFTKQYALLMASSGHKPTIHEYADAYQLSEVDADRFATNTLRTERDQGETQKRKQAIDFVPARKVEAEEHENDPVERFEHHMNGLSDIQRTVLTMRYKEEVDWA